MADNQNKMDLHKAVHAGNVEVAQKILQSCPSLVEEWNFELRTPLHVVYDNVYYYNLAQADNRLPMIKLFIDHGADLNAQGPFYETILHIAVAKQQTNGVKLLLESGADPNIMDRRNRTALHHAARTNLVGIAELLLGHKADPTLADQYDETPLDVAVAKVHFDCTKRLIESGGKCKNIYNSLLKACFTSLASRSPQNKQFIEYVLSVFFNDGMADTNLHQVVSSGNNTQIEALLKKGENIDVRNRYGETPLHSVLRLRRLDEKFDEISGLLAKYGSNHRAQNDFNETSFFMAAKIYDLNTVNLMLAKATGFKATTLDYTVAGAMPWIHMPCNGNESKLHDLIVSIALGYEHVVDRLLDMDYMDDVRKNYPQDVNKALLTAIESSKYKIVKMLLEAGFRADSRFSASISRFSIDECTSSDIKVACLLWEFNDSATVVRAMMDAFNDLIQRNLHISDFTRLLIFYYTIDLRMNKSHTVLLPVKTLSVNDRKISLVLNDCNRTLDRLKQVKVGNMSIFDVMTTPLELLVQSVNNNDNKFHFLSRFYSSLEKGNKLRYFDYAIKTRIELVIEQRKLFHPVKNCLEEALGGILAQINYKNLPDHIVKSSGKSTFPLD
ncbi:tankyrase-2 [Copidosoma floridanum]|uniref:tankyrase-2 n=1 Tax=Copidosoma floridanum TaxID=29053 RepID=UPI000C6F51A2|nr:tankyrase-2 [Copidosoma floridanum]